jgi:hypothetical protein
MNVEFSNKHYERSHGRKPRGTGLWSFDIYMLGGWSAGWRYDRMSFHGTLGNAKKAVQSKLRKMENDAKRVHEESGGDPIVEETPFEVHVLP